MGAERAVSRAGVGRRKEDFGWDAGTNGPAGKQASSRSRFFGAAESAARTVDVGKTKTDVSHKREFMKTKQWIRVGVVMAACVVALTFAADEKQPDLSAGDT